MARGGLHSGWLSGGGWSLFVVASCWPGSLLTVVGRRAMLAEKVFLQQYLLHGLSGRKKAQGFTSQANEMFENDRVMHGVADRFSPREWPMTCHERGRAGERVSVCESLRDHLSGVDFVV